MTASARQPTRVLSGKDRLAMGKKARHRLSRSKLGALETGHRPFEPLAILREAERGRVPRLLAVKYQRMSASPFAFFRGSVAIMAADLGHAPHTGLTVQLCGDAHLQNLGSFEAPDGRIVFDINDFDETIGGPWEWDVKRMAASIVLAGLEVDHSKPACSEAAAHFASTYIGSLRTLAEQPVLVAARHQIHRLKKAQATSAALRQAERATPLDLLAKYTQETERGRLHFRRVDTTLWPIRGETKTEVLASLAAYRKSLPPERLHLFDFFGPLDVAFKIVGTGSVGLRDYVVLMAGNGKTDPLFLQIKQEVTPTYARYLKVHAYKHEGARVAHGQRSIQPTSDLLLGWTRIGRFDYLVRQLNDHKGSVDLDKLRGAGLTQLAGVAGELLARGHARSGDPLAIASYIGSSQQVCEAIVRYAERYAALAISDFEAFVAALKEKRIEAAA